MQLFLIYECLFVCSKKISGNLGGSETMQVVAFCFFYIGTGSIIRLHISLLMQTLKILLFLERLMIIRLSLSSCQVDEANRSNSSFISTAKTK